jgi:hypothetical protein
MSAKTLRGIVRNQTIVLTEGSPEISDGTEVLITRTSDSSTNLGRYAFCSIVGMIVGVAIGAVTVVLLVTFSQILTPWSPGVGGVSGNLPAASGSPVAASPFDMGPRLHQDGRNSTWHSKRMSLGDTGFVADVGPVVYEGDQKPDYYSINVAKPDGRVSHVYFQRDLRIEELPDGFVSKPIAEIVSYDAISRKVSFTIGARRFEYTLPKS